MLYFNIYLFIELEKKILNLHFDLVDNTFTCLLNFRWGPTMETSESWNFSS